MGATRLFSFFEMIPPDKVKVAQVNGQGQAGHDDSHRISLVNCKIRKREQTSHDAAFPKTHWNDAFFGFFGGEPLQKKTQTENHTAAETNDFPRVNGNGGELERS